ncbi:hypothetical protein BWGOE4_33660 [Bacillus mycoides]|nr:hypothetical protein BWGOE2_33770 [Bacillus mycoides]OFD43769.1 hypothetical protein BWGOE1_33630 [Bacillus mycoides]OFD55568.1 hypothetical protein BWGOE4_33660 [Bacillus mycoides]OFD61094.1 hypothetical protein BWGOE7_43040 [Bacillus mycoides]OFD94478.1 hypothetical protein BWGOE12_32830 [Bacillus mycoides]
MVFLSNTLKHSSIIIYSSYIIYFRKIPTKHPKKLPILWILKVPRILRFLVVLRIQPYFHPMPKGNGLSCSGKAVKPGGSFIFSWEHPVYSNLQYGTEEIVLCSSYHEENPIKFETFKGEEVQATLYKRKMSTYMNELNRAGFTIERIEEPEPSCLFDGEVAEPSTKYYSLYKARMVPTTFIIKARK